MKTMAFTVALTIMVMSTLVAIAAADGVLEGDEKLACEAILCLSSGTNPAECSPSLSKYFSIRARKPSDTFKARKNFLSLCPRSDGDPSMQALIHILSEGTGRCDAETINLIDRVWMPWIDENGVLQGKFVISNRMPIYCQAYYGHQYTDLDDKTPIYVGLPEEDGFWVEPENYEEALEKYNREQEEKRRREEENKNNNFGSGW